MAKVNCDSGFFTEIVAVIILIFLFWGEPDNWDKLDKIIDNHYNRPEYIFTYD